MANHRSALKRVRSSEKKRQRNLAVRGGARTAVKRARTLIEAQQWDEAEAAVKSAVIALDRAASKGVIHKNNASRRKSRLVRGYQQARAAAQ
ncbi:MAG: 30S ribosomal protein S20 [Chloroflexota bacterium]|nr:30S ribosomal protein S20 [Chloroflexota bacterium]